MANVNHADLTDPELHEPKGAASAAADTFYVADGAGSGSWTKRIVKLTASCTPNSTVDGLNAASFTVTGVLATDTVIGVEPPALQTGVPAQLHGVTNDIGTLTGAACAIVGARVAGLNTVQLQWYGRSDHGSGALNPTSGTYTFILYRP